MEKIKLLLYCCKDKKQLFYDAISQKYMFGLNGKNDKFNSLNGKIVAECDYEVEEYTISWSGITEKARITCKGYGKNRQIIEDNIKEILNKSCLSQEQIIKYLQLKSNFGNEMYAIHIKNLHIFDKPRNIFDYANITSQDITIGFMAKAPQNMCRVIDEYGNKYILISIRPEWLCKILNGKKTIEVRKKVLKEMINNA